MDGGQDAEDSAADIVDWARGLVEPALRTAVKRLPTEIADLAAYHFGWVDDSGGGKAIRPALAFLSAEAVGGRAVSAMDAAVAVELVHNFSLLHDDVMDDDRVRRHRPAAWTVFGMPAAVLAGDALLVLAMQTIAESDGPLAGPGGRWLGAALLDLVDGQSADLTLADRHDNVRLASCLEMAGHKTGALLGVACALGAYAGGADPERVDALRRFGEHVGLAFQLVDDLLGIWGDPLLTGKPVRADLVARKKSLPVAAALASDGPAARELQQRYAEPGTDDVALADLVERAGGRAWARAECERQLSAALACLRSVGPERRAADRLTRLALLVSERDH